MTIPEEMSSIPLESKEVIFQRIRDLCTYVDKETKGGLSNLESSTEGIRADFNELFASLREEFVHNEFHTLQIISLATNEIADTLKGPMESSFDAALEEVAEDDDLDIESVSYDLNWEDIMISVQSPGHDLAEAMVVANVNYFLWEDIAWSREADRLITAIQGLDDSFNCLYGSLLWTVLVLYYRVVILKAGITISIAFG